MNTRGIVALVALQHGAAGRCTHRLPTETQTAMKVPTDYEIHTLFRQWYKATTAATIHNKPPSTRSSRIAVLNKATNPVDDYRFEGAAEMNVLSDEKPERKHTNSTGEVAPVWPGQRFLGGRVGPARLRLPTG